MWVEESYESKIRRRGVGGERELSVDETSWTMWKGIAESRRDIGFKGGAAGLWPGRVGLGRMAIYGVEEVWREWTW